MLDERNFVNAGGENKVINGRKPRIPSLSSCQLRKMIPSIFEQHSWLSVSPIIPIKAVTGEKLHGMMHLLNF